MNIYLLTREDYTDYDEQCAVVVTAANEDEARQLASSGAGDEGVDRWFTNNVSVMQLGTALSNVTETAVWCRDFHAG
jgi:hypothetical protein